MKNRRVKICIQIGYKLYTDWKHFVSRDIGSDIDIDLDVMYIDYPSIIKGGGFNGFTNKANEVVSYKLYVNGKLNYTVKVKTNDKVELKRSK